MPAASRTAAAAQAGGGERAGVAGGDQGGEGGGGQRGERRARAPGGGRALRARRRRRSGRRSRRGRPRPRRGGSCRRWPRRSPGGRRCRPCRSSALASGSPTAMVWMTTPFCAAMSAALAGAMRLPVSVPSESRIRMRASTVARLEGADGEADGVAEHGVLAGHARRQRVEQAAGGGGVAGEGHEDVGGAAEDDQADAVVAAVGDEAVEHRLDAVEAGAAGAVRADEVAGLPSSRRCRRRA